MGGIHAAYSPVKSLAPALALRPHTSARTLSPSIPAILQCPPPSIKLPSQAECFRCVTSVTLLSRKVLCLLHTDRTRI